MGQGLESDVTSCLGLLGPAFCLIQLRECRDKGPPDPCTGTRIWGYALQSFPDGIVDADFSLPLQH